MPTYNMVPKDKKSPRRPEVRRANVVIYVLPLLLCFIAAVALWCYTAGRIHSAEPEITAPVTDTAPPCEDSGADDTADPADPADPAESLPAESLPAESGAQPSDI